MQFAIDENGIRTSINNSIRGKTYKCPCCGTGRGSFGYEPRLATHKAFRRHSEIQVFQVEKCCIMR